MDPPLSFVQNTLGENLSRVNLKVSLILCFIICINLRVLLTLLWTLDVVGHLYRLYVMLHCPGLC